MIRTGTIFQRISWKQRFSTHIEHAGQFAEWHLPPLHWWLCTDISQPDACPHFPGSRTGWQQFVRPQAICYSSLTMLSLELGFRKLCIPISPRILSLPRLDRSTRRKISSVALKINRLTFCGTVEKLLFLKSLWFEANPSLPYYWNINSIKTTKHNQTEIWNSFPVARKICK